MYIGGVFYLAVVCDVLEPETLDIERVLGVDLGIVNLAVDSDGIVYRGETIDATRARARARRESLQKHGTRSARRRLRRIAGKHARFQSNTNHTIAK